MMKRFYEYGETEIAHLSERDKKLGQAIAEIGKIRRSIDPDSFLSLIGNIIGQQISGAAAATVSERFCALTGQVTPENVLAADPAAIQKCGMSVRKADYIRGIAQAAATGELDFDRLQGLPDGEVIRRLSALRGVGEWTAEMLLLFSFGRPNVLSFKDLGIRRGMMRLYGHREITRERFEKYRKRYSPYGTVASLYLWEIAGQ